MKKVFFYTIVALFLLMLSIGSAVAVTIEGGKGDPFIKIKTDSYEVHWKTGAQMGYMVAFVKGKALFAIVTAIIGILIYISIRFEFRFAIGAIAALVHDVLITLGIFSILNYEISLSIIAAFLTIVGYSLNDTIVVFDRVRENLKKLKTLDQESIFNKSINDSLSRTVITSFTTFLVVSILYIAGGEVIRYFAFAMIIGVLVGTYSSIYVASPVVVLWQQRYNSNN